MSISLGANGNSYNYPQTDDNLWGDDATNWASAVSAALSALGLGATVNPQAVIDIVSTTKGVYFPRMTTTQRDAITSPAAGLILYNTTTSEYNVYTGAAWYGIPVREALTTNRIVQWNGSRLVDSPLTASGSNLTIAGDFTSQIGTFNTRVVTPTVRAASSAGLELQNSAGTQIALLGASTGTASNFQGVVGVADGTVTLPGLNFKDDTNSGLYRIGADQIGIATNGAKVGEINTNGFQVLDNYVCVVDSKANNTPGGTFTSGAWRTRDLNTTRTNRIAGYSLSSNQISLPAGTYRIRAQAPASYTDTNQVKLRNVTDSADLLVGTTQYAPASGGVFNALSYLVGEFTIAATKTIELQHQCFTTKATDGFGLAVDFGVSNVYSMVEIWRLA